MRITNTGTTDLRFQLEGTTFHIPASGSIDVADRYNSEVEKLVDSGFPISFNYMDEGATGPQGPQGIQGPQGLQGIQGIQGPAGADMVSYAPDTWANRPIVGLVDGKIFYATDEHKPYWYDSTGAGTKWFDAAGLEHA